MVQYWFQMTSFEVARQYLLDYLKDEFHRYPEVRFRLIPESNEDGVLAKTETREYFFPTEWMQRMEMNRIKGEIRRMKEVLPDRGEP
jgi:hypothetical protein